MSKLKLVLLVSTLVLQLLRTGGRRAKALLLLPSLLLLLPGLLYSLSDEWWCWRSKQVPDLFRGKTITRARKLKRVEKQPLRAAASSRLAAAYEFKGTVNNNEQKVPSRPQGLAHVLEFVLRLALIWRRQRSGVSATLQDGTDSASFFAMARGSFKAQLNGSLRVSSKCATFLTTQENVKWHKTAERRGETDWGGCRSEGKAS